MGEPAWLGKDKKKDSTRGRSDKQEKRLVKQFSNSGAKFGENDLRTPELEIEAKTTAKDGYRLTVEEFRKATRKCSSGRTPVMVIEFSEHGEEFIVLRLADFYGMTGTDLPKK